MHRVMHRSRKLDYQGYPTSKRGQGLVRDDSQAVNKHKASVSQKLTEETIPKTR
jgi:hypothetical protein